MMLGAVDTVMLSQYSDNSVAAVGVVNQDSVAYGGGFFYPFVGAVQTFFHCYIADAVIQFARL